jgi:glycosyltransferase involved in cell wall biosynthesis
VRLMAEGTRIRLVVVMTHPVQYMAPWFRYIHAHERQLDLKVVYATEPSPAQQGVGFGRAFEWDVPLREGYDSVVVSAERPKASLDSDHFLGLDVPDIVHFVQTLNPDVVLVPGWHSATQVRALYGLRRAGIPILYRGDTHLGTISRRFAMLSRLRARVMLRKFSGYLAVGARSYEYLRTMGVPEPAIVRSPHAIDNEAFAARAGEARTRRNELRAQYGFDDTQRVILFAGKLSEIKRPGDVIEAVARMENSAALFVGDGHLRSDVEAYARARSVRAVFAGFLNQQQMAEAYVASDALMLPGRETWGLVANEALACGLPVAMSAEVGAAADLSHTGVCEVVPSGDVAAFAQALHEILGRRRSAAECTDACQAIAAQFSFAAATAGLVTAARFACRNARPAAIDAQARVVALCGNLVFAGGMERITFEALAAARRGGADVHALVNGWSSRPIAELAERADISWEVGHYDAPLDGVLRSPRRFLRACGDIAAASAHLVRQVTGRKLTHVFAVDFRAVLLHAPALLVCKLLGVPVLLRSGVAPTPTTLHGRLWRWAIRPLVSKHIANSAFTASELAAAGIASERITTIPNVAPQRVASSAPLERERNRVAYVGQVIPEKGVLELLDAAGLLVARGREVHLDVVGQMDGWAPDEIHAYRHAVRERAARPDLGARVQFLGWREDVDTTLQRASVHCCPSQPDQREGFGITVVEAKRAGIPSLVCPSGALPELIDHRRDGWIANGFNADAIAEGLEWLLADDGRLAALQRAAAESAHRFDPAVFERRWQETFGLGTRPPSERTSHALANVQGTSR